MMGVWTFSANWDQAAVAQEKGLVQGNSNMASNNALGEGNVEYVDNVPLVPDLL